MTTTDHARRVLRTIAREKVHATNNDQTDTKGVAQPTVRALIREGLVVKDGARRAIVDNRPARRLTPTRKGWAEIHG